MVKWIAVVATAICAVGRGGEAFQWPVKDVLYKGKERNGAWWDWAWRTFKGKIAVVEGTAVDLGHSRQASSDVFEVGHMVHVRGRIRVLGEEEMVVGYEVGVYGVPGFLPQRGSTLRKLHVKGVATKGKADGDRWEGDLVVVGTAKVEEGTLKSARPVPAKGELTPEEFVGVIRGGFELVQWRRIPVRRTKAELDLGAKPYEERRAPVE